MLEKMLTSYSYAGKPFLLEAADALLLPSRVVFQGKTIEFDPQNKRFRQEDTKAASIFIKILLIPMLILMLPLTLIACAIKHFVPEGEAFQKAFEEDCAICWEALKTQQHIITKCGHIFHNDCLQDWIKNAPDVVNCPTCRSEQLK